MDSKNLASTSQDSLLRTESMESERSMESRSHSEDTQVTRGRSGSVSSNETQDGNVKKEVDPRYREKLKKAIQEKEAMEKHLREELRKASDKLFQENKVRIYII